MPRYKKKTSCCITAISTRKYPHQNCLLHASQVASPPEERLQFLFQSQPRGEGNSAAVEQPKWMCLFLLTVEVFLLTVRLFYHWALFCPAFLSVNKSNVFVLCDLVEADKKTH